ncbi:TPA: hypothetical protein VDW55_005660 [Pseudomonas aeruginosa]|uniref:hypothetical protein n=1 Tax=Pseudomonas rhodesiae TaxID=76760 RepID=UPI0024E018A3|nr:hypothetical protein [Pseudomonas rhodesiae]HEQ0067358.1 hypothetical protein [Pseudomonas aeruginosa]
MSIKKFYAAIESKNVQSITLYCESLNFEPKIAVQHSSETEDSVKYKPFFTNDDLQFIIFEFEDSCPEIGVPIDGIAQNYKILSFFNAEGRDDYFLNTIIINDDGFWEEHDFLITFKYF